MCIVFPCRSVRFSGSYKSRGKMTFLQHSSSRNNLVTRVAGKSEWYAKKRVKCSKYALFLSKNAFFSKKICVFAFFVVPLQPLSKKKHFRHNMSKHATAWGRVGEWLKPTVC